MSLLKNIFDYFDGKISDDKKSDLFSCINASEENRKKFKSVLNFRAERNMLKAHVSQKEMAKSQSEIYAKIKRGGVKYDSKNVIFNRLALGGISIVSVIAIAICFTYYLQHIRQEQTMEYLATVEIENENSDVDLLLSTGERIAVSDTKTELNKSDVKIVADGKSVSVSSVVPQSEGAAKSISSNMEKNISDVLPGKAKLNYLHVKGKEDYMLSLEDGSKIWLRHDSKVGFPNKFSDGSRVIEFEGEGYFDIASDSLRPFIIKTKDITAKVLGTEFNLKSENSASLVEVSMISGKLAIENNDHKDIILTKNHQLLLDTEADSHKILKTDNFKYKAWKEGYFFFENDRLDNIIKVLSHMYEIEIVLDNKRYDGKLFNGKMKRSNGLDKIVAALEESYEFKFHMEDGVLHIY